MGLARLNPIAAAGRGAEMPVRNPSTGELLFEEIDGKQVAATITLLGRDAKAMKAAHLEIERERAQGKDMTDEEVGIEMMVVAIIGWSAAVCINTPGDLPFSKENARRLVTDEDTAWIGEQIAPFTLLRRNFPALTPTG